MALITEIYFSQFWGLGNPRSNFVLRPLLLACRWPPSHCVLICLPCASTGRVGMPTSAWTKERETKTETENKSEREGSGLFFSVSSFFFFLILFICLFIYFWLCWVFVSVRGLPPVAASRGHSSSWCTGLSLSQPLLLWSTGSRCTGSVVVAHGPSCSAARGILPDQGSNPCPLHWQADSQPLRHQGSPLLIKTQILWDQGPTLMISFNLNYFLRGPISKKSHTGTVNNYQSR